MTREEALEALKEDPYPADLQRADYEYTLKKFGLTQDDFEELMDLPVRNFTHYPNNYALMQRAKQVLKMLQRFGILRGNTSL